MAEIIRSKIKQSAVTVTTTATALPATAVAGRNSIAVYNNGTATIYIGGSDVTITTGFPLQAAAQISLDIGEEVVLYAIIAESTANVRILEGV